MRKLVFLITVLCLTVSGCIPLAVTAVSATTIVKRDSIRKHLSDQDIKFNISNQIFANKELYDNNRIVVVTYQSEVLLLGQVRNETYHKEALQIAKDADGVSRIYDQLSLGQPIALKQKANDSLITAKVKARILGNIGTGVIVTTENNVVYLMGSVTRDKSEQATEIARTTTGVAKVVKIFKYTT